VIDRRSVLKGMGGLSVGATLAGCLGDGERVPRNAARLWHGRREGDAETLEAEVERFTGETGHEVHVTRTGDLGADLARSIPANNSPELFGWAHNWVGDFSRRGLLHDVSYDVDPDLEASLVEPAMEAVRYGDGVFGVPYGAETVALLYNEALVDTPPETVDELVEAMERHHDPDDERYGLSYPMSAYSLSPWAHAFGGYYFDDATGELGLTNDETLRGIELATEALRPYRAPDRTADAQMEAFSAGNVPFAIDGPWAVDSFVDDVDVGVAPLPAPEGGEPRPYVGILLWYFSRAIKTTSERRREAARSFERWYARNEELALKRAESRFSIPVQEAVVDHPELPEGVRAFARSLENGLLIPLNPRMNQVWRPVDDALDRYLAGEEALEPAFERAEARIRESWENGDPDRSDGRPRT
jgi:arabinogalactan oligomer / maltooligosaccharide transport system substrate-binding protein